MLVCVFVSAKSFRKKTKQTWNSPDNLILLYHCWKDRKYHKLKHSFKITSWKFFHWKFPDTRIWILKYSLQTKYFRSSFNKTDDAPFTEHARDLSCFGTFRLTIELEITGISFTNFPLAFFCLVWEVNCLVGQFKKLIASAFNSLVFYEC